MQQAQHNGRGRILVCDDDLSIEPLAKSSFGRQGLDILFATNAEQAFAMYLKGNVSAVVTDVCLPGNDGYWLMEKILSHRDVSGLPKLPMVSISGQISVEEGKERLGESGGLLHKGKPADWSELSERVAQAVLQAS